MFPSLIRWVSAGVLGLGLCPVLDSAIAPLAAQIIQVNLAIAPQPKESYVRLLHRGERLAEQALNARFRAKNSPPELKVTVIGENNGLVAPLLSITASRQTWLRQPQASRWATYYPDSQGLLGFRSPAQPAPTAPPQPASTSSPTSPTVEQPSSNPPAAGEKAPDAKRPPIFETDPRDRPPEPPRVDDRLRTPARIEENQSNPLLRDE